MSAPAAPGATASISRRRSPSRRSAGSGRADTAPATPARAAENNIENNVENNMERE
jgi:hypothetical protein